MKTKKLLTTKQKLFCKEYLVDLNGTQAAIRSGYSEKTARVIGQENLQKPALKDEIQKNIKKLTDKVELQAEEILKNLKSIIDFDIKDLLTWDTKLIKIGTDKGTGDDVYEYHPVVLLKEPSEVNGKLISEISISSRGTLTIKTHNKLDAIEKGMKYLGMFEKDNAQNQTDLQIYIDQADRRAQELSERVMAKFKKQNGD